MTSTPTAPVAGDQITLALTDPIGTTVRGEITSVPAQSALLVGMMVDPLTGAPVNYFTPDVAGVYGVKAHDWRIRYGIPSYSGDPAGDSQASYQTTQSGTVAVGIVEELPIVTLRGHGATLQMTVMASTVAAASLVRPLSEASRKAILTTPVVDALKGLVDVATTALDVAFVADVVALRLAYESHRLVAHGTPDVHNGSDDTNVTRRETPSSVDAGIATLNDLYEVIGSHQTQGPGGGTWHNYDDGINTIVTAKAASLAQAIVMKADLRERVYERHRVQVGSGAVQVHNQADTTAGSAMASPLPLPILIVAFLDAIVAATETAPTGELQGASDVEHLLGMRPADS